MTTREQLLEHIRKTKQRDGYFGEGVLRKAYEVYPDLALVWYGRKTWKVPADVLQSLKLKPLGRPLCSPLQ